MEKNVAIEINHISKVYQTYNREFDRFREALSPLRRSYHTDFTALKDVNLTVYKGECVGVIGTNGSGKSTLLKIVTGVLHPTGGEVKLEGRVSSLLELGAGFNPNYTGIENVYLNGRIMGFSDEEIKQRLVEIEKFAAIGDFIRQPVRKYSSGMFARLAFAVAIHVDPDILIVDEALSVGDVFFQNKCYHKFDEFRKAGKTILFVSHDLGSILKYCDRCLLLNRGEQVAAGPSKEVVDTYRKIMVEHYQQSRQLAEASAATAVSAGERKEKADPKDLTWPTDRIWKNGIVRNPEAQEYGDMLAEIIDYGVMNERGDITGMILKGETYTVLVRFRFNAQIDHPIFAVTLRDKKGTEICGTNTLYEDAQIETAEKGLTGVVRFTQRMTLQGGEYMLSLGLTGYLDGELHAYHRLYDICTIQVLADVIKVGYFDMESKVAYDDVRVED
ncbi:MAG: ABC transporter ATP-binding protein [Clostridia bacterium]|nr:ABC transporter ATP-binding protein [Clostridia bacterium]